MILTSHPPRDGDRVRVTYEGVVTEVDEWGAVILDDGDVEHYFTHAEDKFELLEPAPRVGHKVSGAGVLDKLPLGSLVCHDKSGAVFFHWEQGWVAADGKTGIKPNRRYTIAYLPDGD